ncbi:hypothetical protein ACWCRF_28380 [Streptomyces sp. NPDC002405]
MPHPAPPVLRTPQLGPAMAINTLPATENIRPADGEPLLATA